MLGYCTLLLKGPWAILTVVYYFHPSVDLVSSKPFDLSTCFSLRAFRRGWISVYVWRVWHTLIVLFKDSQWHTSKQPCYVSLQGWAASVRFNEMLQFALIKPRNVMTPLGIVWQYSKKEYCLGGETSADWQRETEQEQFLPRRQLFRWSMAAWHCRLRSPPSPPWADTITKETKN